MSGENILEGFLSYVRSERYELLINWFITKKDIKLKDVVDKVNNDAKLFEELENLIQGYIDVFGEDF